MSTALRPAAIGLLCALALAACAPEPDDEIGEEQQAQLDPTRDPGKAWRSYVLSFSDGTQLATVNVFTDPVGSFARGTEYWVVNSDSLGQVGVSSMRMAHVDHDAATLPSDPGYTHEQRFTLAEFVSWGTPWRTDPFTNETGGAVYGGSRYQELRLQTGGSPAHVTRVTWYQFLPSGTSPTEIAPDGVFQPGQLILPKGYVGYDVSQRP